MSPTKSHEALVGRQFGTRVAAYLSGAVHAQGAGPWWQSCPNAR